MKPRSSSIPQEPGIYKMLDQQGEILYVGKAKNLRKRVSSYFTKTHTDIKTAVLVSQIRDVQFIVTSSEKEALILEDQLVKLHRPKYNISLKDDKSYPYIKITVQEPFPRVLVVRQKFRDGALYFGPYPHIGSTRHFQRMLYDLFPIRDCHQAIDLVKAQPKCINLDLGRCVGPCVIKSSKAAYDDLIEQILMLLSGKNKQLIRRLKDQMKLHSEKKEYEKAAHIRDRIQKLELVSEPQSVNIDQRGTRQAWAVAENSSHFYALIQTFVEGQLLHQQGLYTEKNPALSEAGFLVQSILSFFGQNATAPKEILVDPRFRPELKEIPELGKFRFGFPERGLKKTLLSGAEKNARFALSRLQKESGPQIKFNMAQLLEKMKEYLRLRRSPKIIVGFDISHLQGTEIVGSAVYFENGLSQKDNYRQYRIRTVSGKSNDPASMREIVGRRLRECLEKNQSLPDLLLIDGGRPQLNAALKAIGECGLSGSLDVLGLAKKEEEIYFADSQSTLKLDYAEPALQLFQRVRDESHRFALRLQRKRRGKNAIASVLDGIAGLGEKRINLIYQKFKTVENVKKASAEEIAKSTGLGKKLAQHILEALKTESP